MKENLKKARDIYWSHACNHFHIDREGLGERYKELGGNSQLESVWREQYIAQNLELSSSDLVTGMRRLAQAHAYEALSKVVAFENYSDNYEKFWYAFYLQELTYSDKNSTKLREFASKKYRTLWEEVVKNPENVAPNHESKVEDYALKAFDANNAAEYFTKYSQCKLDEVRGASWDESSKPKSIFHAACKFVYKIIVNLRAR